MKLNVGSMRQRLQKSEQYITELEKQQPITLEKFKTDFLVHLYWDVNVEKLYQYLQEDVQLLHQFRDFALQVLISEEENE